MAVVADAGHGKPPHRNRLGSLLRLVLFVLVIAALVAFAWLAMDTIEHHQSSRSPSIGSAAEREHQVCGVDKKGNKVGDCGKCICSNSNEYGKHNRVLAGLTQVGKTQIATYKCTKGCGGYQ